MRGIPISANYKPKQRFTAVLTIIVATLLLSIRGAFDDANERNHITSDGSKQISDINLNMPVSMCQDCRKVSFNISAINGCYQWEVSHDNMLALQTFKSQAFPECSNIAQVSAISLKPSKSLIWITARDKYTGQTLRCETKLGKITRLEIRTHLRQFYVDNYEHLHITGYDDEGNVFNSLDGFRFEWSIEKGSDLVKMVSTKEAAHKISELQKEMEFSKLHRSDLFLKGLRSGIATLSVRIVEHGYEEVLPAYVTLTITEPFTIIPSHTVYLLPTSIYKFSLAKVSLKNNEVQYYNIDLPDNQYEWEVDDNDKSEISNDGYFKSKDKEGFVNVLVRDTHIRNNTAEGSVRIVYPWLVDLEIVDVTEQYQTTNFLPSIDKTQSFAEQLKIQDWDSNWVLVENHIYYLKIFLFDKDKHPIFITDNLVLTNVIDTEYFEILRVNRLKSEFVVKAKKVTERNQKVLIVGALKEIRPQYPGQLYYVDQNKLRSEKEVKITKLVGIIHPTDLVLLPFLKIQSEEGKSGELWQLQAEGGSGYYTWQIQDPNIASISGSGLVRSKEIGTTNIIVRDNMNQKNVATLKLEVTSVYSLTWLEDHLEIEKKQEEGTLNTIALDRLGRKFTNCTAVRTQFEVKGEGILVAGDSVSQYKDIREYVLENKDIMFLKQRFEESPSALTIDNLPKQGYISEERQSLLLHNNFGICSQQKVSAIGEGLGRAKAFWASQEQLKSSKLIESNYAEIAAYSRLTTLNPHYNTFFSDLATQTQNQQEEFNFNKFYQDGVFNVAFGSSILWVVQGGTNFWKDINEKYQIQFRPELTNREGRNQDQEVLEVIPQSEQVTLFQYNLHCQGPRDNNQFRHSHQFRVYLQQQNKQTRHLLRPAVHNTTIEINCEPPVTQRLYWSQEDKALSAIQLKKLPRYKLINNEKTHYVLVNSLHLVRALMFQHQNYVFYNHSSIINEISSSDQTMLRVRDVRDGYQLAINDDVYDKRRVQALNITGTVYLRAQAQGYYKYLLAKEGQHSYFSRSQQESLHLNYDVKDQMRIEIVRNVDIQPKYKSIYISNKGTSYNYKIIHGSSHFAVNLNNTDLAEMQQRDGKITIYPRRQGSLEIKVEDIEIPESEHAISEMLISDIARLELDSPGTLLEQGSQIEIYVTAFDNHGNEFDKDQYESMEFFIEIESTSLPRSKGLIANPVPEDNRKFIVKGYEPGNYQVTAYTIRYRPPSLNRQDQYNPDHNRITSDVLKLEVFPLLEILPGNLLLTPLMRYTLQIAGGPTRSPSNTNFQGGTVEIKFDVEDKHIASVDAFREVTGLEVGDTKLYYEVIQLKQGPNGDERRSIISKKMIPIRVRLVTSIDIPYNNQRLVYGGSMIKLIAILKYNTETFTHGIAPISYNWNCSNPNIISMQFPSKTNLTSTSALTSALMMVSKKVRNNENNDNYAVFFTTFNTSSMYGLASRQGEAQVVVALAIEYPNKYRNDKNYFQHKIIVRVNEKLAIDVPEYINNNDKQTHLYLVPPNTYSKIETNKKTRMRLGYSQQSVYDYSTRTYQYTDSQTPIIQLEKDEGIRTFDKYGKVTVIVEENQAFSDQLVMLNVLITDIYNIAVKDVYQALSLPLGSTMQLPVKFQNEHAHSFARHISGISVGLSLSHPRVVLAQLDEYNSTLSLSALGSGECNLVVYLVNHPHIYDVFKIRVSSVVKPTSPVQLHVGSQVTFKIMDTAEFQHKEGALWSSSSPNVLDINQATGKARSLSEGRAEIMLSNHINAASIAYVSKVKHAEVDEQSRKNLQINTDESSGDIRVRVKLFLNDQLEELTPTVQFDGITLINQNVGIMCEAEHPNVIAARSEISELEGYFCILNFANVQQQRNMPKQSKIFVTVFAPNPHEPNSKNYLYKEQILSFEVSLISNIKVESMYRNGISLNKQHRTAEVKVFSNVQFNVQTLNLNDADKGYDLVRYRVNKSNDASNEYYISLTVPREITHEFQTQLILTHPVTSQKVVLPIYFSNTEGSVNQNWYSVKDNDVVGTSLFSKIFGWFRGNSKKETSSTTTTTQDNYVPQQRDDEYENRNTHRTIEPTNAGNYNYLIIIIFIIIIALFCLVNVCGIEPADFFNNILHLRWPFGRSHANNRRSGADANRYQRGQGVRDPVPRNLFGQLNPPRTVGLNQSPSRYQTPGNSIGPGGRPDVLRNAGSVRQPMGQSTFNSGDGNRYGGRYGNQSSMFDNSRNILG